MPARRRHDRYGKEKAKRERRFALQVAQEESGRQCGECTACCMVLGVAEVPTPFYSLCPHQSATCCRIYDKRPGACREFYCEWLVGALTEEDRPDKLGLVCVSTRAQDGGNNLAIVAAYEVRPGAGDTERARAIFATSKDDLALIRYGQVDVGTFTRSGRIIHLRVAAAMLPPSRTAP
jgi:hypothetical protein